MGADLWSYTGAVKKVAYDNDGQPVGGDANKLTTFLGCLARNGEFFPISTPAWSEMKDEYLKKAWDEIQFQKDKKERDRANMYVESHTRSDQSILPGELVCDYRVKGR